MGTGGHLKGVPILESGTTVVSFKTWHNMFMAALMVSYMPAYIAINGSAPAGTPAAVAAKISHSLALSLLILMVDPNIGTMLEEQAFTDAKLAMEFLNQRFGTISAAKQQKLLSDLFARADTPIKDFDVIEYINDKRNKRLLINSGMDNDNGKINDSVLCNAILTGLPKEYNTFCSSLNSSGSTYTLEQLTERLDNEQLRIRRDTERDNSKPMALPTIEQQNKPGQIPKQRNDWHQRGRGRGRGRRGGGRGAYYNKQRDYNSKGGADKPRGGDGNSHGGNDNPRKRKCFACGSNDGHIASNCPKVVRDDNGTNNNKQQKTAGHAQLAAAF